MKLRFWTLGMCCLLTASVQAQFWTTAYYPGGADKALPVEEIDFSGVSHIVHFAVVPNADGSLNLAANGLERATAEKLIARAHGAGRKALVCVGGADSATGFQGAAMPERRATFVANLVRLMEDWGYDGMDLDWEPLAAKDFGAFTNLTRELRAAAKGRMLTAAASAYPIWGDPAGGEYAMYASVQTNFDQINIMTYDLSGPYEGWISWFNSPVDDGGCRFALNGRLAPSIDGAVRGFLAGGVTPGKLGVGVPFYGDVWVGSVSEPRQSWKQAPTVKPLPYSDIMTSYFNPNSYHWDTNAQAAYLSLGGASGVGRRFISYDDERACQAKTFYARRRGLGGVMIWQLADGHLAGKPEGRRDPLLRAIKDAVASPLPLRKDTAINIIR